MRRRTKGMVGSHSKKFIFFHLYKCAGTAITNTLAAEIEFTGADPHLMPSSIAADPGAALQGLGFDYFKLDSVLDDYYTFSFVRNPWAWQVSLYKFMTNYDQLQKKYWVERSHHQQDLVKDLNFEEYIEWRLAEDFTTQYELLSHDGTTSGTLPHFVGKTEELAEDFAELKKILNFRSPLIDSRRSFEGTSNANPYNQQPYQKYYSKRTRDLIGAAHAVDINTFNYDF